MDPDLDSIGFQNLKTGENGAQNGVSIVKTRNPGFCPKGPPKALSGGECFAPLSQKSKKSIHQNGDFHFHAWNMTPQGGTVTRVPVHSRTPDKAHAYLLYISI